MANFDRLVAATAGRQLGIITRPQAAALGLTRGQMDGRVRAGRWTALGPGVYLIAGVPVTWHVKLMAACVATGGVASHRSAAVLHGLDGFRPGRPEITVRRSWRHPRIEARVHESLDIEQFVPVFIEGIPTTPCPRLAVDLGAVVPFLRYQKAMFEMIGTRKLTWDDALDALLRHSRQGRNGCGRLRALLTERMGIEIDESALERATAALFERAGLPRPERQVEVFDADGYIVRVDFAYVAAKIAIEVDGRRFHGDPIAFEQDRRRRSRLAAAGWLVLEFTWERIFKDPTGVVSEIARALATVSHP